jgi:hypothetical protein
VYKKVNSKEELDLFHQIKQISWDEKGFDMEYAKSGSDLFLIYEKNGLPGGTVEFTPYSHFISPFMRDLFDDVIDENMVAFEIDSFSVLPQYRGKLGTEIMCLMVHYAEKHAFTHAFCIADPSVFASFQKRYQFDVRQVKTERWYKGGEVIPALLNLQQVYQNKQSEKFSWLTMPLEKKEGALV